MTARLSFALSSSWSLALACLIALTFAGPAGAQEPEEAGAAAAAAEEAAAGEPAEQPSPEQETAEQESAEPPAEEAPAEEAAAEEAPAEESPAEEASAEEAMDEESDGDAATNDASDATAPWPQSWATSIAPTGVDGELVVGTADGLLLREGAVVLTSVEDVSSVRPLYEHPTSVWAVVAGEDLVCSTDYRGNLLVLRRSSGEVETHEAAFERWTRALALAPDGQHVVGGNEAGKLIAWSLSSGERTGAVDLQPQQIYSLAFAPGGDLLAATDGAGKIHLVAWPSLELKRTIEIGSEAIWDAAFVSSGDALVAGGAERKLWRVPLAEGSEPTVIAETSDWITSICAAPDHSAFAACLSDGNVLLIGGDASGGEPVGTLPSGGWDIAMPNSGTVVVATRKHALATLGRSWTVTYAESPESSAATEEDAE